MLAHQDPPESDTPEKSKLRHVEVVHPMVRSLQHSTLEQHTGRCYQIQIRSSPVHFGHLISGTAAGGKRRDIIPEHMSISGMD